MYNNLLSFHHFSNLIQFLALFQMVIIDWHTYALRNPKKKHNIYTLSIIHINKNVILYFKNLIFNSG